MISRIGLGTVQFGVDYGINNRSGRVKEQAVGKILDFAQKRGVNVIDTATVFFSKTRLKFSITFPCALGY